jgi:hypothetical protein
MIDATRFFANPAASMTIQNRNRLVVIGILAFPFVLFLGFLFFMQTEPLPPIAPLPNPNGYDDFVKAVQMLPTEIPDYDEINQDELRAAASVNAGALSLVRSGLSNECRVPIQFSKTYMSNHLNDLAGLKRLAQAFTAEGKLAEMENRPNDAAKSYIDTIHFGNESARGGVLIDELVGIAIEAIGRSSLTNLVDRLGAKSCRETAATLETLDAQRQTWDEVMQQENNWSRRNFPGMKYEYVRLIEHKSLRAVQAAAERKFKQQQIRTRQLMVDLAARAYELDKGKPPASLADLVPDYLQAIPQDPLTGANMVYSPR